LVDPLGGRLGLVVVWVWGEGLGELPLLGEELLLLGEALLRLGEGAWEEEGMEGELLLLLGELLLLLGGLLLVELLHLQECMDLFPHTGAPCSSSTFCDACSPQ
jgi:hypothetical protein